MFKVYGADLTKAIAEFDTINEAMVYAKKGLRDNGHGRSIKDTQFQKWLTFMKSIISVLASPVSQMKNGNGSVMGTKP